MRTQVHPRNHRRVLSVGLMLVSIAAGLFWRLAPLHLPWFAYKYGGSALWAIALYWLIAATRPRLKSLPLALIACAIAALLEFSRLYHLSPLDAFRLTLTGKLLLGRIFSPKNRAAYWLAVLASALLDYLFRPRPTK
jgi:hypothetical protein